jgi:hypothetical protein
MTNDTPLTPRGIPPQPTIAWFLRDLVPDELWNQFDIGLVRDEEIRDVQEALAQRGGSGAWLRLLAQTRALLPQLLAISIYDLLKFELTKTAVLPRDITFIHRPELLVFAGGYGVQPPIRLTCTSRFAFHRAGAPISDAYELANTDIVLRHKHWRVLGRVRGEYFVPVLRPKGHERER